MAHKLPTRAGQPRTTLQGSRLAFRALQASKHPGMARPSMQSSPSILASEGPGRAL
eukprot:CAMPEP_0204166928 /NCGR_PEP_ID=MMETSP0361-20130328/39424_1 /ASSEMBLY_ACC=CAM_ASM_000343 /TAXON_ID=268821 /ORGANISM="Scrippsiella Hangoei, Strain SHTV-5" /LENGTH=55 /DNA_ID=CAMNT_0051124145 /DNA_START=116 /DNA_END=280 /DNA_ORIENTATION=+